MSIHFYNHEFHNFLAKKNEQMLAKNAISKPFVAYYKKLNTLTHLFVQTLDGVVSHDALAGCRVVHITKTLLVISTPHTTVASYLKSIETLLLDELNTQTAFATIQTLHISVADHVPLKNA